jgi:plasmid stability protein
MQYTLRNIPEHVDHAMRDKARREHRSLNEVAIEALSRGLGVDGEPVRHRDLTDIADTWIEDPEIEAALEEQRTIDHELWR